MIEPRNNIIQQIYFLAKSGLEPLLSVWIVWPNSCIHVIPEAWDCCDTQTWQCDGVQWCIWATWSIIQMQEERAGFLCIYVSKDWLVYLVWITIAFLLLPIRNSWKMSIRTDTDSVWFNNYLNKWCNIVYCRLQGIHNQQKLHEAYS